MRNYLLTPLFLILFALQGYGQTTISFATGSTPVVPAPFVTAGSVSIVGTTHVQLTPPAGSQTGRIYTSTPVTMGGCGSFTCEFEFQTIPSSTAWAIADGIAFWIVSPLSGFVGGGGIGLPTNPNGLVLVLDNYDNDGVANDPLVSLYGYPSGFTGTYVEGVTTNRIGALNNQNYVRDGGWHHVKLTYAGGNIKVFFNYSGVPSITGYFPIATSGYIGFSASTGGAWSTQSVRNFQMTYNTVSDIYGPDVLCLGGTGIYLDSTAGGTWSSSNAAVGTISTAGVLTPLSAGTTTIGYTYSGSCTTTKVVTVSATTISPITGDLNICSSTTDTLSSSSAGGTWASSHPSIAAIGSSTGIVTPAVAGTTTITYTLPSGCFDTAMVTIQTGPPTIAISPSPASVCDNGSITLTASAATTYNLIPVQSWETGIPSTPTSVPTTGMVRSSWTSSGSPTTAWYREPGVSAVNPTIGAAVSGAYVANFNSRSFASGSVASLYSPTFSMTGVTSAVFSIWVYRDVTAAYNTATYDGEGITINLYTTTGSGSTTVGTVPRRGGQAVSGSITGTSTTTTSGWYQYTYTLPTTLTGSANYIGINALSRNGNNVFIDSITLTGTIGAPTWAPSTYLFSDAGLTTAYTGTAINPVYMRPTGITTPTTITYTASLSNGSCSSTGNNTVTMNPNPATITGATLICIGSVTTLSNATTGGSWTSTNTAVATIGSSSGIMTGVAAGTTTISYSFGGCATSVVVTVVASPGAITGVAIACLGATTTLSNSVSGGVWSSSNTAVGTVNATTGIVTGISLGTTIITYGIATCYATIVVTVNPYPTAITGSFGVCVGATTTLSSTPTPGVWTSSTGSVASVGVISGIVTGVSPGTSIISYRVGGCTVTTTVNVVTTPGPMTGTLSTCVGSTTALSHAVAGGTWSSSDITKATVGSSSGIVTGVAIGTARITYSVGTGCFTSSVVTINAAPAAPTGVLSVCIGNTTTLAHGTPGGTWSSSSTAVATVGLGTGVVSGVAAGTSIITYHLPVGCLAMATVTVNSSPAAITGLLAVCQGATTTLSSATPSGTWISSNTTVATIGLSTGIVNGLTTGTSTISYTVSGCVTTAVVTINGIPAAISGPSNVCTGNTITLTNTTPFGAWSSSNPAVGTISGAGVVTGLTAGTTIITYALGSGCFTTTIVTCNLSPGTITRFSLPITTPFCTSVCTSLNCTPSGGTWSSSDPSVMINLFPPEFFCAVAAGTAIVSYTRAGCSSTVVVTVIPVPGSIGGTLTVCAGQTTTLTNATAGGTWATSTPAVGTINTTTGVFTGISTGTTAVFYSLSAGCTSTTVVTVNANPGAIGGTLNLCAGVSTTLSSSPGGGTWSCVCPGIATIGVGTGILSATGPGTCTVVYTLPTGCSSSGVVTVNALPAVITGVTNVCVGSMTTLSNATPGGAWSSSNGNATINATTGVVTGAFAGTSTISYIIPATGCFRTIVVLVSPLPTGIGGSLQVCEGSTTTLSGSPVGGTWVMSCPTIGTVGIGSGSVSGISLGTCPITYTLPTGCYTTATVSVNPLPAAITGVLTTCIGQTTTLSSSPGVVWSSSNPAVATVNATTGIVSGVSAGTATIVCQLATGCSRSTIVTVYALPGLITGAANVCVGLTTTLNCVPSGGTWTMGCANATIGVTTGIVTGITAGTCEVTYTLGTGCTRTTVITVNSLPASIGGSLTTCSGQCTSLTNPTSGGAWSSSTSAVGTINSGSGLFCGISAGTSTISYTVSATGCRATAVVTVYALPGIISGTLNACEGQCTSFTNSSTGGTWASSNPAVGTINTTTGLFCGILSGTSTITYTLGTGCITSAVVSVNPVPLGITGTLQVCETATTTLGNATGGGTWSSATPAIATVVSGTGVVTGVAAGTAVISYTIPIGCAATAVLTVHANPSIITGPTEVCEQSNITLSSTPGSGVWSSATPLLGTIHATSGVFTGLSAGTALVSYTIGIGCVRTVNITVNAQPGVITGNPGVCIGFTSLLATTSTGGTWSSSNPGVATIDASGLVTSVTLGTTLISYTLPVTGCRRIVTATVNGLPAPITGSDGFCNLSSTTYTTLTPGVRWSTSDPSVIVIDSVTGVATGVTVDTADIIVREIATGCTVSKSVFLILAPYPITGSNTVCLGQTTTLSNVVGGGVWSSSNSLVAPITSSTGVVFGLNTGTSVITYVLSTGCSSIHNMTVNPIPVGIIGSLQVCEGLTTTLTNSTPGGTWVSSIPSIATIGSSTGLVTGVSGGTTTITYALSSGCNATVLFTVNALPDTITGTPQVCEGLNTTLSTTSTGGLWSSAEPSIADIAASTGIMTGMSAMTTGAYGTGVTMITYTLPTGCIRSLQVTVNPLPSAISGPMNVCEGDVAAFTILTPGGGWISSNPAVGSIDGTTGIFTGITAGGCIISYVLPTGCIATRPVTVNANPVPIGGSLSVCAGFSTNLTSGPAGGLWSQDPMSMVFGTINPLTGVVSGIIAGTIPVTYTQGSGCRVTETVTVITLPSVIGGTPRVCVGDSTIMTNPVAGGTWSSSNTARATIDAITGMVHGITAGTAVITYTVGTGCFNVHTITVNALPASILGPLQVCEGSTILLSNATPGGLWISDTTAHATVGFVSGIVTGISAGLSNISYSIAATGCLRRVQVTVNQTPPAITGNPHICIGAANTFSNTMPGGFWYSSNPAIATIGLTTGIATSVTTGIITISYVMPATGCMATRIVTVQPLPTVYNVTGGGNYCAGGVGNHIYLSGSQPGVSYALYNGATATGYLPGTGFALDFGLLTGAGVYTVQATNVTSGCMRNMAGSATITITPLVTPSAAIIATPDDSVCAGQSVTLTADTANAGNAPTYLWKVNGVSVGTAISYAFVPAHGDVATVAMTSNANCLAASTAAASKTLTVLPDVLPVAGVITTPNDTVCQFNPVTFTADPTYGGTAPVYNWFVNGTSAGTAPSYSYIPVNGDVVTLEMVSNYRCLLTPTVRSGDVVMSVDSLLIPQVLVYPNPGFEIEVGKPATILASVINGGPAPKYQWKVNGYPVAGATQSSYTAVFNDYDSIACEVISSGVCNNIGTSDWLFISIAPTSVQPGIITAASNLRLLPNPNKGAFTIKGTLGITEDATLNAEVTDMLGQVVYRGVTKATQGKVDAQVQLDNTLANGMYILTLRTAQEQQVFHFVLEQ